MFTHRIITSQEQAANSICKFLGINNVFKLTVLEADQNGEGEFQIIIINDLDSTEFENLICDNEFTFHDIITNEGNEINISKMFDISNNIDISEEMKNKLVQLLGKHARSKTRARLNSVLTYDFSKLSSMIGRGYSNRIIWNGKYNNWLYCAGQGYNEEIKNIRDLIIK